MGNRQQLAAYNRDELLSAAERVFRIHGGHVPLQVIIDHAGVGRATFYRNFSDRKALLLALLEKETVLLEDKATSLLVFDDGIIRLLKCDIGQLLGSIALRDCWQMTDSHDVVMRNICERRERILQALIDKAIQHKRCRPDLTVQDIENITSILGSSFQGYTTDEQARLAKRAVELWLNGIKI